MTYLFFESLLNELGHKLNYEAVVNYAGNSFCQKSWDMIKDANPMITSTGGSNAISGMMSLFNQAQVIKVERPTGPAKYSWEEGNGNGKDNN